MNGPPLGLNRGESRLHDGAGTDLRTNSKRTGSACFGIARSLTLTGERSHTASKSVAGESAKLDGAALGATLFF